MPSTTARRFSATSSTPESDFIPGTAPSARRTPEFLTDRDSEAASLDELATASKTPGVLRSDAYLTVQTKQAQRLIQGRKTGDGDFGIIGLTRFASLLLPIWNGAKSDDPYADWWLLRIDDALEESEQELMVLKEHVVNVFRKKSGIAITLAQSTQPIRVKLVFANPYAFRGAYLLALYDEVVRGILTARHVSLLDGDATESLLRDAGKQVRRAFNAGLGYRFLSIARPDIKLMTARAIEAEKLMGALPQEIFTGQLRAAHAPTPPAPRRFALRDVEPELADDTASTDAPVTEPQAPPSDGAVVAPSDGAVVPALA